MSFAKTKRRKNWRIRIALFVLVALSALFFARAYLFPHSNATSATPQPAFRVSPKWPDNVAAAALGARDYGVLATTGDQRQRPIASIAKVITALVLLDKYPLHTGQHEPRIPITEQDEQLYRDYVAQNGTVVLIKAGTSIGLRDALEAMLLTSANNVADTAAIWAFGSMQEYHAYANHFLQRNGLQATTVGGDASGLRPDTKSTVTDLVKLGELALQNPIVAEIVAETSASIPVAGPIPNYNALVTKHGFSGIKPGDTIEAGITSLFSTNIRADNQEITLIGVILGANSYRASNDGALQIVRSTQETITKADTTSAQAAATRPWLPH